VKTNLWHLKLSNRTILSLLLGLLTVHCPASNAAVSVKRTTVLENLDNPWDLAFASDGSMFFTEKCLGLSVRDPKGSIRKLFGGKGYSLKSDDLACESNSGMNGIALDPDSTKTGVFYVYRASNLSNPRTTVLVCLEVSADLRSVTNRRDIVTDISFKEKDNSWGPAGLHSGGRIKFGPDRFLYVTTGDNHNGDLPQNLKALGGKVLRIKTDGSAAPGNQSPNGADPRIYTYGHRNIQGLTFHPTTGQPFIAEHGPNHSDEITALEAGKNGGWDPRPESGVTCADSYCGYVSNRKDGRLTSMTDLEKFPDAMKPVLVNKDSAGMGPALFLTGNQWKEWRGRLFVGIMGAKRLDMITFDKGKHVKSVDRVDIPSSRVRALTQSPDGALYIATDEGAIWRLTP
jgi:glucose/arabinose dehydrogenase